MMEQDTDSAGMSWDSGQHNEDCPVSDGLPSANDSATTEESSLVKQRSAKKSINANGPGKEQRKGASKHQLYEEIQMLSKEKKKQVMKLKEPDKWKNEIQQRIEHELEQQVREALETPPLERMQRNRHKAKLRRLQQDQKHDEKRDRSLSLDECNSYAKTLPSLRNQEAWNKTQGNFRYYDQSSDQSEDPGIGCHDRDSNSIGGRTQTPGAWGDGKHSDTTTEISRRRQAILQQQDSRVKDGSLDDESDEKHRLSDIRRKTFHRYTATGFKEAMKQGKLKLKKLGNGRYMDKNGVILTEDGPFWPPEYGPLYGKPEHVYDSKPDQEPLSDAVAHDGRTVHTQRTKWYRPWERSEVVFDSERTSKGTVPHTIPEGCCPSVVFESRFESGNLRQAKRIGQFEYDLVLKTDLYTNRHTQWYYFRVQRMIPGVTYKFNIVNLLKKDSLYNHGMRPLMYSEKEAETSNVGWMRCGHHISYTRSYGYNRNSLLHPEMIHYVLEWQMEFRYENDTCYLAHCYPYTFTDLKDHLDSLLSDPARKRFMKREVLCETRAGNSCFLLTVTNFSEKSNQSPAKKAIVVTARVHPGETNASWMMKGLLDYITGSESIAKQLRDLFIFKIIPMLNPDGVIVGNYRCSLSARDLNRNYRHPKKDSFPTVWHLKNMLQELTEDREVVVYCDLHGHSRKHNVFIYGCDPQSKEGDAATFLYQRLFPWLMSQMAPDKFSFRGCKFRVKRCKEATGRVVMWRQMNISNSFTMEATFCGAKNMESVDIPRHFNTSDFQDLGRHFCEALLEYHKAQQNKSLHSELILELTREITHQVLQSRGHLPVPLRGGDYNGEGSQESSSDDDVQKKRWMRNHRRMRQRQKRTSGNVISSTAKTLYMTTVQKLPSIQSKPTSHGTIPQQLRRKKQPKPAKSKRRKVSKDKNKCKSIVKTLARSRVKFDEEAALDQSSTESESDHVDSNTGDVQQILWKPSKSVVAQCSQQADPMAKGDQSSRSTTKSSKKDHHKSSHEGVRKIQSRLEALKMIDAMSSETIKGCMHILQDLKIIREFVESDTSDSDSASESELPEAPQEEVKQQSKKKKKKSKHKSRGGVILPELKNPEGDELNSKKKTSCTGKFTHLKKYPPFVNKYIKRSNGGIPMFSQERSQERMALKRMHTIHKIQQVDQEDSNIQYTEAEYNRLVAMTKQIQEQEAEVFKMSAITPSSNAHDSFKYTHSNSFHGLQQFPAAPSPHHLQPMDPVNTWNPRDDNHQQQQHMRQSHTMMQSLHHQNHSVLDSPAYRPGGLETDHGYHGSDLTTNHSVDDNNNCFNSSSGGTVHHGNTSKSIQYGFGKRALTHLHMKQKPFKNDNAKPLLGRPSLSAALPANTNTNHHSNAFKSSSSSSSSRHKTAPVGRQDNLVGKMTSDTSVPRGHAADLISQQYDHFLSQTPKLPQSAAARYLDSLTKSISKADSSRPVLAMSKANDVRENTFEAKKLSDLKAKTEL